MASYKINFFKTVLSSDGHPFKCIQGAIEVHHARNIDRAVAVAERRFEQLRHIPDWKTHADFLEVDMNGAKVDYKPKPDEHSGRCYRNLHGPLQQGAPRMTLRQRRYASVA